MEYDCTIIRLWDAVSESIVTFSFRDFWNMFEKMEVYELPLSVCRHRLYELGCEHIYTSYTKERGSLENVIEWQNALRRKSIRNSWWSLFCEHISIKNDATTLHDISSQCVSTRVHHVLCQMFVHWFCLLLEDTERR